MGILKIGHLISGVCSHCRRITCSSNVEVMEMGGNQVSQADSGGDSDECEFTEVRCELGIVEGQQCNIPYELYDLQDLRDILSLDTWNSCLTDDERFSLSAYLPDMDQQTFWLTLMELLGGGNLFFGNPLDMFFKRLKGGLYPPKVTCFREGLWLLQRRMHYHLLSSYHENMAKTFIDMRRVWDQCTTTSTGVEERIYIWTTRKNSRGNDLLDLNASPMDGYLLGKGLNSDASMCHLSNKKMSLESKRTNNMLPSLAANRMNHLAPNSSGKGILKIKASGSSSIQKHNLVDTLEQCHSAPKGVLKIVPKVPSTQLKHSRMVPMQLQPTLLVDTLGFPDSRFSSFPEPVYQWDAGGIRESPFQWQEIIGQGVHRTPEQRQCILSQHETGILGCNTRPSKHSEIFVRKIKREKNPLLDAIADLQGHKLFGSNVRTRKGGGRGPNEEYELSMDSMDARKYAFSSEKLRQNMYPIIPEIIGEHEAFMASSDRMKGQSDANFGGSENLYSKPSVFEGLQQDLVLPLTYKRRKASEKFTSLDFGKQLTTEADLKSATPKGSNHHPGESAKAVKIKFKGWNSG